MGNLLNVPSTNLEKNAKVCQVSNAGNIHGFINLSSPQKNVVKQVSNGNVSKRINNVNGETKIKSNSNSTIVINKKFDNSGNAAKVNQPAKAEINIFSGRGKPLTDPDKNDSKYDRKDYSTVRNHWSNKFPSTSHVNKRNIIELSPSEINLKKQKIQINPHKQNDVIGMINLDDSFISCPVCNKQIEESLLNGHLDSCLLQQENNDKDEKTQQCFVCNKAILQSDYRNHVNTCFDNSMSDEEDLEECEICNIWFNKNNIETHRKACIENLFVQDVQASCKTTASSVSQCTICDNFFDDDKLNDHKEQCLLKVFDDIDKKHNLNLGQVDEEVSCLVCNKKVFKSELKTHLDECMCGVFDEENDINVPSTSADMVHECDNKDGTKDRYNCPFCLELYSELDMSGHLDQCLVDDEDGVSNKTILIDSFSDE